MKKSFSMVAALFLTGSIAATSAAQVDLQNGTGTFSQTFTGPWNVSEMIDSDYSANSGWAIFADSGADRTSPETAVFETVTDLTTPGLSISMFQNYSSFPGHLVGRFRWSYTTDSRNDFADGLQTGGDVTANWTVLTPTSVSTNAGVASSILGDGSVLMSFTGGPTATGLYTLNFNELLTGVTGLRLEVLADPSLPVNGPGLYGPNGNFVISEIEVAAVPEPATLTAFAVGAALLLRRKRKA